MRGISKKLLMGFMLLILCTVAAACSDNASKDNDTDKVKAEEKADKDKTKEKKDAIPSDEELFAVVDASLQALKDKDIDAYMDTGHSESPVFDTTKQQLEEIIDLDLSTEISDMKVVEKTADKAKVSFVQRAMANEPLPEFRNNEVRGYHELRPDNGKWKIYLSQIEDVTYLDEDGNPIDEEDSAQADGDAKMEGKYADKLKNVQFNWDIPMKLVNYEEDEDYAGADFEITNDEFEGINPSMEFLANTKGVITPKQWIQLVKDQFKQNEGKGKIKVNGFDTTENETMIELTFKDANFVLDQAQIGRAFFKGNDLIIVNFVTVEQSEIPKDTKKELIKLLKKVK
ncbi:hypothetical protein P5G51_014815 [Virgibacillus sp. 179-BFC.A HS]|uniref:Lipoprotein n=1 Tax=Tigheibacillus jepli TaxID=3035914 RepID=A0ABU5CJG7_9BACI|nr:hypothetical protein [Virgibacillus sp. 179-BFC.A HS]MDY0406464.1 hypothetical protein [Virgibacillus sp. 179-BFC.A HS]